MKNRSKTIKTGWKEWDLKRREVATMNIAILSRFLFEARFRAVYEKKRPASRASHRFLRAFRYFCSRSSRELVDLTIRDLILDVKEMRRGGRSERFIKSVIFWRSLSVVVTMSWSAVVEPVVKVWGAFKAK